jgi:hypothetical protein
MSSWSRTAVGVVAGLGGLAVGAVGGHSLWPMKTVERATPEQRAPDLPAPGKPPAPAPVAAPAPPPEAPAPAPAMDTGPDAELRRWVAELRAADPERSFVATVRLDKLGDVRAVPALIEATRSKDVYTRVGAAKALGDLKSADAVPALIEMLTDGQDLIRQAAEEALTEITLREPSQNGHSRSDWGPWWKENEERTRRGLGQTK